MFLGSSLQWLSSVSSSAHMVRSVSVQGMYMIRFHSFYPWHSHRDYMHLCNDKDLSMMPWVQDFKWVLSPFIFKWYCTHRLTWSWILHPVRSKFDLYTKTSDLPDVDKLKPYYQSLIDKYCPGTLKWWNQQQRTQRWHYFVRNQLLREEELRSL